MQNRFQAAGAFVCAVLLSASIVGCGQQAGSSSSDAANSSSAASSSNEQVNQEAQSASSSAADSGTDKKSESSQVATYHGAKSFVSGAEAGQASDNAGLQETCVVRQPESWKEITSIGWGRNSISYAKVAMPWGDVYYQYEYVNEADAPSEMEEYSRTNEESFASSMQEVGPVEHTNIDGHEIAYVYEDLVDDYMSMGMVDLEAKAQAEQEGTDSRVVSVYTYEQRADKCALYASAICHVTSSEAFDLGKEQLLADLYAPLEFAQKDANVDAASYFADVTITNGSGNKDLVIKRNGRNLVSYTEHTVSLLNDSGNEGEATIGYTTFDFAPQDEVPEDAQAFEVDGKTVRAVVTSESYEDEDGETSEEELNAWIDLDGDTLYVVSTYSGQESMEDALQHIIGESIALG